MIVTRAFPVPEYFAVIEEAAKITEEKIKAVIETTMQALEAHDRWQPVEYYNHHEDIKV